MEKSVSIYFESVEPIIEIHASSMHTLDFHVLLSEHQYKKSVICLLNMSTSSQWEAVRFVF